MNLTTNLSRRAAIVVSCLTALGLYDDASADTCSQKCRAKKAKDKRRSCVNACQKSRQQNPFPFGWAGYGQQVTEGMRLPATRALATTAITVTDPESDNFIIWIHGPQNSQDLVVNEIPDGPGTFHYQRVVQLPYEGTYFLEVMSAAGSWDANFTRI